MGRSVVNKKDSFNVLEFTASFVPCSRHSSLFREVLPVPFYKCANQVSEKEVTYL